MTLDDLFAQAAHLGYIFDLKQTGQGWTILLWDGPIGYSQYVTTLWHTTPHSAIEAALASAALGQWKELDNSRPTCALEPSMLDALSNLLSQPAQPVVLSPLKFKFKT